MSDDDPRMKRESNTIETMITLSCRDQHDRNDELCSECRELLDYARACLARCPFREHKPTCAKCPVHCYTPAMREKIKAVMRYSGPRMFHRHPLLAIRHFIDGLRKEPRGPKGKASNT